MNRIPATDILNIGVLFKEIELCRLDTSNICFYRLITGFVHRINDFSNVEIEKKTDMHSSYFLHFKELNDATEKQPENRIEKSLFEKMKIDIKEIWECLYIYLSSKVIAFPESKKMDIQILLKEPYKLFNNYQILIEIPESIREDLILFCQCYAYGIYTSAVIHILKATENYNIYFYNKMVKTSSKPSMKWGTLIAKTQSKLKEKDPLNSGFKTLIDSLSNLKNNQRIEIIHFNKVIYSEEEAYNIFEDCHNVISKMFYIVKNRFTEA